MKKGVDNVMCFDNMNLTKKQTNQQRGLKMENNNGINFKVKNNPRDMSMLAAVYNLTKKETAAETVKHLKTIFDFDKHLKFEKVGKEYKTKLDK